MRNSEVIKGLLVIEAWREGKEYGGNLAAETVAWCLANRVRRAMGDWMTVLKDAPKYRAIDRTITDLPNIWEPSFVTLCQHIDDIYDNVGKDLSCGGVFYADASKEILPWFKNDIIQNPGLSRVNTVAALTVWG